MRALAVALLVAAFACGDNIPAPAPDAARAADARELELDAAPDAGAPDARIGSIARLQDGGMVCVPITGGAPCDL